MLKLIHNIVPMLVLATFASFAYASEKLPLDAVVIMDSSGSMKKTDPQEMRKPAAKLFINLLGENDRLSVMSFSDNAYPITYLTQLNTEKAKDKSYKATDKVSSKGVYTNIYAAVARGIEILKESDALERDPIIVLMSDGKMDVGNQAQSDELRDKVKNELIPLLNQHKIKIYSIAFTDASVQTLLQEIADATDGRYALAASDDVLHKVFAKIFEQSKEPNLLPLTENEFVVDPSIREITIIANKKSDKSQIFLETPTGERISSTFKSEKIKWFVSSSFDMITLSEPEEGAWKILFSDDDNKAYIVADIKLRTQFEYSTESYYPELNIKTWFEKEDEVVAKSELLSSMDVILEIEHPDGQIEEQAIASANEEGFFLTIFKPGMDGIYAASIIAKSKTFQRQQIFSFRAVIPKEPPPTPKPEPEPEPVTEPTPPEEPIEPPIEQEEDDLMQAVIIFLAANLVLAFIGLNVFFFLKMKKQQG